MLPGVGSVLCAILLLTAAAATGSADKLGFDVPAWAFPGYTNPPPPDAKPDDVVKLRVPESRVAFTQAQLQDLFAAPDWFPERHAPMPVIVARGRRPDTLACAYCHLPDGTGRPENAALAGLSADYIRAQVADLRNHTRKRACRGPRKCASSTSRSKRAATKRSALD